MKPTIKTIAKAAGVSPATVSKALNNMPDISEATKERIRRICEEMGYMPNANARSLVSGSTHTIGLLVSNISDAMTGQMCQTIVSRMEMNGFSVFLCENGNSETRERAAVMRMLEARVDALMIQPLFPPVAYRKDPSEAGIPVVYLEQNPAAMGSVAVDEREGGRLVAQHLFRKGHRRCAVLTYMGKTAAHYERIQGFGAYMQSHGGTVRELAIDPPAWDARAGNRLVRAALEDRTSPTALFAIDDALALDVLASLRAVGRRVPEDVSLVGYGDMPCASLPLASLTTARIPSAELGVCASDIVLDALHGKTDAVRHMALAPTIIARGSVANEKR